MQIDIMSHLEEAWELWINKYLVAVGQTELGLSITVCLFMHVLFPESVLHGLKN